MSDIVLNAAIPPMSPEAIGVVSMLESAMLDKEQVPLTTWHSLHGGTYTRTICIPAGVLLTGALIKVQTTLIVSGHCHVYIGDKSCELQGYNVVPASAGRKQAFMAITDTWLTMMFKTDAASVEEAETQFTDEYEQLGSRRDPSVLLQEV